VRAFKIGDRVQRRREDKAFGTILSFEWSAVGMKAARVAVETDLGHIVHLYHVRDLRLVTPVEETK